ncbi:methyltransferase domain-containing protein [Methanosalsum natronophilum]|uniref:Methyltransferase domain-containing protein n=1 Tax=Methanosalsum natronophilum TaxID=768733 RepID=A0A424YTW6_9EURY|nr:MAG: methyltransferase domain-containing protein [Methanosalsum natronophilum]
MNTLPIGKIKNYATEESLNILALWKDAVSIVDIHSEHIGTVFTSKEYSHYIIIHDPLQMKFSDKRSEWNHRFTSKVGVSIVQLLKYDKNKLYLKGLIAENGSNVYDILPYTSFDHQDTDFPVRQIEHTRKQVLKEIIERIDGNNILDVGCGVGSITMKIANKNTGSRVYGIDIIEDLVGQSKLNAEFYGINNIQFSKGDIYKLYFEDNSLDTVICFFMLHHLDNIPHALSEINRVLKKNGTLIASDPLGHHHGPQLDENDWKKLFKDANFQCSTDIIGTAVVSTCKK